MSQTKLIMIDDTDPSISYTGDWIADKGSVDNLGNYGAPYMSTNHYIKGTGSFTYTFFGTYVGVFGTTVDSNNPNRQCKVDGAVIPNNQLSAAENGVMHCQVNGLSDGKHTLVVTVPTANPSGYWFDYLMYIPSASVSQTNAVLTYLVGDPSMNYGTGWSQNGPGMVTTTNGATFTMQFTGGSLIWLGYYLSANPFASTTATWSIDGGAPVSFNLNGIASQSTGAEFNQRFFSTGVLSGNDHTLKVVYNGNSGTTPLSIYQVLVQNGNTVGQNVGGISSSGTPAAENPPSSVTSSVSSPSSTSAAGGSTAITGSIVGGLPTSTIVIGSGAAAVTVTVDSNNSTVAPTFATFSPLSSTSVASSPTGTGNGTNENGSKTADTSGSPGANASSHTGAIAGAVGGVVALLLLLLVFFLRRRRARRRADTIKAPEPITQVIQPFTNLPSTGLRTESAAPPTEYSSSASNHVPSHFTPGQLYTDEKRQPSDIRHHAQSPSLSTFSSPSSNGRPESELIMVHQDSGVRLPLTQGRAVVEMPPTYSAD